MSVVPLAPPDAVPMIDQLTAIEAPAIEADLIAERPGRVAMLQTRMRAAGWSATVVASPENIYYLLGLDYAGYFAVTLAVVPATGRPLLMTRRMEAPTVAGQAIDANHLPFGDGDDPAETAVSAVRTAVRSAVAVTGSGIDPIVGLEERTMFLPPAVADALRRGLPDFRWTDATETLASARSAKSDPEIAATTTAAAITTRAMTAALSTVRPGIPDRSVAGAALTEMLAAGGDLPGFAPLVRPLSALSYEHVNWTGRRLSPNDGVFIELSGCWRRYHAPMSRTVYLGQPPDGAEIAGMAARAGQTAAADALRPGARAGEVYDAWRSGVAEVLRANGWPADVPARHHCGYLIGIGFPPSWTGGAGVIGLRADSDTEIHPGMTFHLMSWLTHPAPHVISDTVLVTPTTPEFLTQR